MSFNKGLCEEVALFDFSKAFNGVRHDYLIHKLFYIGISGALLKWIINYRYCQVSNVIMPPAAHSCAKRKALKPSAADLALTVGLHTHTEYGFQCVLRSEFVN